MAAGAALLVADEGEHGAEPLVLDNRPLVDLLDLVKGTIREFDLTVADRRAPDARFIVAQAPEGAVVASRLPEFQGHKLASS